MEPRKQDSPGCRRGRNHGRQHGRARHRKCLSNPAWSETLACVDALCAGTGRSRVWPAKYDPAYQPRDPTQVADFRGSDGGSGRMAAISPITRGESTAAAKIVLLDQWV